MRLPSEVQHFWFHSSQSYDENVAEELLNVLTRFHREVVVPDLERIIDAKFDARLEPFREEVLRNFDAVFQRLDRLESEYHALSAALRRLEERMTAGIRRISCPTPLHPSANLLSFAK